MVVTDLQCCPF